MNKINKNKKIWVIWWIISVFLIVLVGLLIIKKNSPQRTEARNLEPIKQIGTINLPENTKKVDVSPTASPTATLVPTISFEDLQKNFGPCVKLSVLMYHHIQDEATAKTRKQTGLTVTPESFRKQMEYLKTKNYEVISPERLIGFFNGTEKISPKSVMITLDDAYEDNYKYAYPILKEYGFKATIFTPTGLLNNPDYLNWDQLSQMKDLIYFGNHTWSHHSSSGTKVVLEKEIGLADTQLKQNGYNAAKVFAYPYGTPSKEAKNVLTTDGYNLAFTTTHGSIMCKGKSLELPRIRIGNGSLSSYGL